MENIAKNWFLKIKNKTITKNNLTEEELKSIDEAEKIESGEWDNIEER